MKHYNYGVEVMDGRIVRLLCACERWLSVDEQDQADCPDCSVRFNRVNRPDRLILGASGESVPSV